MFAPFISFEMVASRTRFVSEVLSRMAVVDLITTDFDHGQRKKRKLEQFDWLHQVIYIPTLPYRTNISMARFASHFIFSIRAAWYFFHNRTNYNVVYSTVPLNLLAYFVFLMGREHKKIVDIVDIWPEVLPFHNMIKKILFPVFAMWKLLFIQSVNKADIVMAVSDHFLEETRKFLTINQDNIKRFYIGHSPFPSRPVFKEKRFTIVYLGNIGRLYDFETLLEALSADELREKSQLFVIGDGDRRLWLLKELRKRAIFFTYFGVVLSKDRLASILQSCHVGFNGYISTPAAFSFKASTYFAAGLPIINSMRGDLWQLVEKYKLGFNYQARDLSSLKVALSNCQEASLAVLSQNCAKFFAKELELSMLQENMEKFLRKRVFGSTSNQII